MVNCCVAHGKTLSKNPDITPNVEGRKHNTTQLRVGSCLPDLKENKIGCMIGTQGFVMKELLTLMRVKMSSM